MDKVNSPAFSPILQNHRHCRSSILAIPEAIRSVVMWRQFACSILLATALIVLVVDSVPAGSKATAARRRVVLIQVDGVRADYLDRFLTDGTLPPAGGFAALSQNFKAVFQTVVTPSVTTPNLTTMVTGVYPQKHGAIANTYPLITGSVTSWVWGHQQPLSVEPIWTAALRAGKKVGLIRTVGVTDNAMTNTWTLNFHEQHADPKLITPTAADWSADLTGWNLGSLADAKSPRVMTFTLEDDYAAPYSYTFNVVALDRVISGTYDALVIDDDHDLSDGYFGVRPPQSGLMRPTAPLTQTGSWSSVIFTSTNTPIGLSGAVMGAYLKLYEFSSRPLTVSLYATGVWYNPGNPREWINNLYRTSGPFPRLTPIAGVTTEQDQRDFEHREVNFFLAAALDVLRRDDWDLVILYQGIVDHFSHPYLLTDPRQVSYTHPISLTYWNYIREAYQTVDESIATISNTVGLTQTDMVVASDHGFAPVHTTVYLNRLLAQAGIAVTPPISAYAQAGGGYAEIYINTVTRAGGVISPAGTPAYTATQEAIVSALSDFTDVDRLTGQPLHVFDNVIRHQDLTGSGLDIETAGDVFVTALPGYSLDGSTSSGPITLPVAYGGTHGYAPNQPEMHGVFLAAGPHFKIGAPFATRLIDVAPTIAEVLGLDPLPDADGVSLLRPRVLFFLPIVRRSG
jgi:predicted AlkP superfamily pyrophosphatase or phosphodiesterase